MLNSCHEFHRQAVCAGRTAQRLFARAASRWARARNLTALTVSIAALTSGVFGQTRKPSTPKTPQFGHWGPSGYHLIRKIPIPGNEPFGRLEFDPIRRRVFLADGSRVLIINPYLGKIVGNIPAHGARDVAFAPELHRGFITEAQSNDVAIFDSTTLKVIARTRTGKGPDAIVYDPATKRVFTMNPGSNTATAINGVTGKAIANIALGGEPTAAVSDTQGHIYINLQNTSEELQVDAKSFKILNRWPTAPCKNPAGISIDPKERVLFAGCANDKMGIMNADTGKMLAAPAAGSEPGTGRFDPVTKYALSANGDGTLTIVVETGEDRFNVVEHVDTERGANRMALDPKIHEVFLVTADFQKLSPDAPRDTRPAMIPGTVRLLVFARDYAYK